MLLVLSISAWCWCTTSCVACVWIVILYQYCVYVASMTVKLHQLVCVFVMLIAWSRERRHSLGPCWCHERTVGPVGTCWEQGSYSAVAFLVFCSVTRSYICLSLLWNSLEMLKAISLCVSLYTLNLNDEFGKHHRQVDYFCCFLLICFFSFVIFYRVVLCRVLLW